MTVTLDPVSMLVGALGCLACGGGVLVGVAFALATRRVVRRDDDAPPGPRVVK